MCMHKSIRGNWKDFQIWINEFRKSFKHFPLVFGFVDAFSVGLWVCFLFIFFVFCFFYFILSTASTAQDPFPFYCNLFAGYFILAFRQLGTCHDFSSSSSSSRKFTSHESRGENVQLNNLARQISGHVKIIDVQQQVKLPQTNKPTIPANIFLEKVCYSMKCGEARAFQSISNSLRSLNCSIANYLAGICVPKNVSSVSWKLLHDTLQIASHSRCIDERCFRIKTKTIEIEDDEIVLGKKTNQTKYVRQCLIQTYWRIGLWR